MAACKDKAQASAQMAAALRELDALTDVLVTTPDEIARRGDLVGTVLRPSLREGKILYDAAAEASIVLEVGPVAEGERLGETRRWLREARIDLTSIAAILEAPGVEPHRACYLSEQAAEKALRAVLVFLQIQYPFTPDLDSIRNRIPEGWLLKKDHPTLRGLSDWAFKARYPGDWVEPTAADARDAYRLAQTVLQSVVRDLAERGLTLP